MRWGQLNRTAGGVLSWVNCTPSRWCPSALLRIHRTEWRAWGGGSCGKRQTSCREWKCKSATSPLGIFGSMKMVSGRSGKIFWLCFHFFFFFLCPQQDDNSFASIHHNLHQTDASAFWCLQSKFVPCLRLRWKIKSIMHQMCLLTVVCAAGRHLSAKPLLSKSPERRTERGGDERISFKFSTIPRASWEWNTSIPFSRWTYLELLFGKGLVSPLVCASARRWLLWPGVLLAVAPGVTQSVCFGALPGRDLPRRNPPSPLRDRVPLAIAVFPGRARVAALAVTVRRGAITACVAENGVDFRRLERTLERFGWGFDRSHLVDTCRCHLLPSAGPAAHGCSHKAKLSISKFTEFCSELNINRRTWVLAELEGSRSLSWETDLWLSKEPRCRTLQ